MSDKDHKKEEQTPRSSAFTIEADGKMPVIMFDVHINPASLAGRHYAKELRHKCRVVWNTGSARSQLSRKLIEEMSLEPIIRKQPGQTQLFYKVDVYLPNKVRMAEVEMTEMDKSLLDLGVEGVIGMDIISLGDCSLSHHGGKTFFSFRVPALGGVDYVKLDKRSKKSPTPATTMVRRNQMCPCGSGKRYKNCCGRMS